MAAYFFEISNLFCKGVALVTNPKTLTIVSYITADIIKTKDKKRKLPNANHTYRRAKDGYF